MFFRKRRCCRAENKPGMDCRAFTFPSLRQSGSKEWISCAHGAVFAAIFKIFGEELGQAVVLGIAQMRAPCHGNFYTAIPKSAKRKQFLLWGKHGEFSEQVFPPATTLLPGSGPSALRLVVRCDAGESH